MSAEARAGTVRRGARAVLRWVGGAEQVVGGLLVLLIFVLMLVQAGQRYLPVGGWLWTGELARFSLVWLTFALAGYLMGRDGHISLKLVDYAASGAVLRGVRIFANVVVAAVCVGYAAEAYELLRQPSIQTSPSLGIPVRWIFAVPFVGLSLTAIRAVLAIAVPRADADDADDERSAPHTPTSGGPIG
ncbi:TRAP-type C4-dicarboxylate transport system permease small subunit [Lipingzhangella halophila]|uniref:TRAP-type C4-dicarboxylate transport system permease small subunit n=1 Tax=Lipingzhangella halophila TaxID=1783352 RepID=A0A7W7W233_9ACTN|nr:TRAP transporter small permease subunit [Lipingzhangella halophila]MBB4931587.1 TRAP-type C4-dicarboxylate transport system permease small subunit [Lipingzhangella halophila]